jgi:hypothetical protein
MFFRKWLALFAACFMLVSCLAYFSTLEMEAVFSSKMSVGFDQITWCYIPEDRTLLTIKLKIAFGAKTN